MRTLPEWIYIDGTVYYYDEFLGTEELSDFYFCMMSKKNDESIAAIPFVKDKYGNEYWLCTADLTLEAARADLLERINNMK